MIITADLRNEDWGNHAFGNEQRKKDPYTQGETQHGKKTYNHTDRKPGARIGTGGCFHCGGDHFKRDCPNLEGIKNGKSNHARSGEQKVATHEVKENLDDDRKNAQKREVVMGEVAKLINKGYKSCQCYFDSGSNIHITACKEHYTTLQKHIKTAMLIRLNTQRPDYLVQAAELVAFAIEFDVSMSKPKGEARIVQAGRPGRDQWGEYPAVSEANKAGVEADMSHG
ncbi:hypothetical protein ABG067_007219 [Albugo candida]